MNLVSFSPTFKLNISSTKVGIRTRFDAMQNVVIQRKKALSRWRCLEHQFAPPLAPPKAVVNRTFCIFRGNKKIPIFIEKSGFYVVLLFFVVVPPGIEPGTQGFSVLCSTNWAMAPFAVCECKVTTNIWFLQEFAKIYVSFLSKLCFWAQWGCVGWGVVGNADANF